MPSKGVQRRWSLDSQGIRRNGSKSEGFEFITSNGKRVRDARVLARIERLRIPPAWQHVRIAQSDNAPLQAVGVDRKGRTQYLYHLRFRQQKDDEKFLRIVRFGESLSRLRNRIRRDLSGETLEKQRVLAAIVRLIDQGFFRIGNDRSAQSEKTFGLTTVRSDHVSVKGSRLHFDYMGKWKKKQFKAIDDPDVARVVRELRGVRGEELFKFVSGTRVVDVKDHHVNDYIQSIIGEEFTAKDFRTWAGTLICSIALAREGQGKTQKQRKSHVVRAIEATAELLGNTPAVCRSSYICPRLIHEYMGGRPFESLRRTRRGRPVARVGLSIEEKALVKFLRETIADRRNTPRAA